MELTLNEITQKSLEKRLGLNVDTMSKMDIDELDKRIEKKIKKKLGYQSRFKDLIGRGNIFLYLGRLLGLDYINKKLSKI